MLSVLKPKGLGMASRRRWPSRWWWWVPFIGANLYLLALYPFFWGGYTRLPSLVSWMLVAPIGLFLEFVAGPAMDTLGPETFGPLTTYAIGLALWELMAVVLGLACYCAVLLVHAIVPGGPDSGDRERAQPGQ